MFDLARVDLDELVMALSDRDVGDHQWLTDPATGVLHLWSEDVGLDGEHMVDADSLEETGLQAIEPIASREQWCPDCSRPCRRLGAGGICPSCEEMITVEELTTDAAASSPLPLANRPIHH